MMAGDGSVYHDNKLKSINRNIKSCEYNKI